MTSAAPGGRGLIAPASASRRLLIPAGVIAALVTLALVAYFAALPPLFGDSGGGEPAADFGAGGDTPPASAGAGQRADYVSLIATARGDTVPVYRHSTGGGQPWKRLSSPNSNGAPLSFLVKETTPDGKRLRVLLPTRPNGSTGWVPADEVTLSETTFRVHVYLGDFRVKVMRGAETTVLTGEIGLGKGDTPTPEGQYYITSLLETPGRESAYGAYAFGLSGFSTTLESFAGGPGRVGLHGTDKPQLLGQRVSHGCIRMSNANIKELAGKLPLGTPVYVHT